MNAPRNALEIDGLSKTFRLASDPVHSLKERILRLGRGGHEEFRALAPVSLDIPEGQTVGILGHNGSGKSTMLKCIAGILRPTTGEVRLRGRLASLLELGAGFHPELSGRENVFINASFLGISRKEITAKFDEIVDFAELQHFIDEPVKHYSSGMYVRLGFAVAVNLDPDILLVDEVLAVGDEVFQMKCISRVKQLQAQGKTIVFVTHATDTVREICDRAIVLHRGAVVADDIPAKAIRVFREHLLGKAGGAIASDDTPSPRSGAAHDARLTAVSVRYAGSDKGRHHATRDEEVTVAVSYEAVTDIDHAVIQIELQDRTGRIIYQTDTDRLGCPLQPLRGTGRVEFRLPSLPLLDGDYPLAVRLTDEGRSRLIDLHEGQNRLSVISHERATGLVGLAIQATHIRDTDV